MTPKQAKKIADKTIAPRFGLLMENGNGVWIYEGRSSQRYGRLCHERRFRGCVWNNWNKQPDKHIYSGKKYEGVWLEHELYRTDWKVTLVSAAVLDAILLDKK